MLKKIEYVCTSSKCKFKRTRVVLHRDRQQRCDCDKMMREV